MFHYFNVLPMYSTNKLLTAAECDQAIALATNRKAEFTFDQTVQDHSLVGQAKNAAIETANLISVNAQITGTEASIAVTTDGTFKTSLINKLRRLNDRKDNLNERMQKGGNISLLDAELDTVLIDRQMTEIDAYIAAVTAQKAKL